MPAPGALAEYTLLNAELPARLIPSTRLERIAARAARIDGAEHAAVTVWDECLRFSVLAWSSSATLDLEPMQFRHGEGPAMMTEPGTPALIWSDEVRTDSRWPTFGPALADDAGMHSLLSQRFVTEAGGSGAINVYSSRPAAFAPERSALVEALAAHAVAAISAPPALADFDRQVQAVRDLGCAMGILMQSEGLDRDGALGLLRVSSQRRLMSIGALAQVVIELGSLPS